MSKFKLWLGVLVVFICGALAGMLGSNIYYKNRLGDMMERGPFPFPPGKMLPRLLDGLDNELNLTDAQKNDVRKILRNTADSFRKMRTKYRPEMEKIKERTDAQILKVLDPEQQEQFHKMMERFKKSHLPPRPGFHRGGRPGPPAFMMDEMEKELHLKPDQKEKVRAILDESRTRQRDAAIDFRFKEPKNHDAMKVKMFQIELETEKNLKSVLSDKQLEILKQMKKEKNKKRHHLRFPRD